MQWSPELSELDIGSGDFIFHSVVEPGTAYEITINMTGSNPAMLGRYLGCVMFGFMPDEGLEEALFSLRNMLDFYSHKPAPQQAKLVQKAIDATIADKKIRPDLVLSE